MVGGGRWAVGGGGEWWVLGGGCRVVVVWGEGCGGGGGRASHHHGDCPHDACSCSPGGSTKIGGHGGGNVGDSCKSWAASASIAVAVLVMGSVCRGYAGMMWCAGYDGR